MSEHSPLPWRKSAEKLSLYDKDGFCVGNVFADDNAELIVTAVNSHASLTECVKVLREALKSVVLETGNAYYSSSAISATHLIKVEETARAALSRAKELVP